MAAAAGAAPGSIPKEGTPAVITTRKKTDRPTAGYDHAVFAKSDATERYGEARGWEKYPLFHNFCRDLNLRPDGVWNILRQFKRLRRDLDISKDGDSILYSASQKSEKD